MRRYSLLLALSAIGPLAGLQAVPSFEEVRSSYKSSEAVYLDRRGRILQSIRLDESGRRLAWTSLDRISPALLSAVVRSEDKRFYSHSGADYLAILKAAFGRIAKDTRRGASTITMQLASRLDDSLTPSSHGRTYEQKWRQIQAAREIEKTWSKSQILEAYLNLVPFRGELEGISAASFGLFGKDPHALGDTESVILAALIRGPQASAEDVLRRSCMLAYSMKLSYDCSQIKPDVARAFEGSHAIRPTASYAPHLPALIKSGESEIRTTLDLDIQLAVREILHRHILSVRNRNVRDGAVLVLDNRTGEVIAYVGSTGDLSLAPLVDSIRSRRQAGSALKPFVYAVGIDKRLITASTLLDDTPLNMPVFSGVYHPENYDRDYFGPVAARIALASSRNIPAVRLVSLLGVDSVLDVFRKMEFKNLEEADFYGPSIALGSMDVTLWQLTSAYRMFASGGEWSSPFVERTSAAPAKRRIVSEAAAFIIGDILSDRESRSLTFGLENVLSTPFWTAVKTGTSKDMRDNWCVGYSDRYTVGVWVGNA
ncbi:MAG TPA: penicillin-binding protein 1C, partial [Leptospiraceae bacterium]|nr:penicillin-binding protein 1C [Leptospiraceae bacterium]